MNRFITLLCVFSIQMAFTQVTLNADGPGNTTNDINAVLAPGYDAVEEVCNHTAFGDHIDEVFDTTLNAYVFRFTMHLSPDNNKCVTSDRQRNEIKTYNQSPDNLKGVIGETVQYKWKFKLDTGFQPSPDFTHIHQLKSVGADAAEESQPLITLTARYKSAGDELQLRLAETTSATTLDQVDLDLFKGEWVDVAETVTYGEVATSAYSIVITRVSDNLELMNYSSTTIRMWKTNASFMRPKWGIYRKNTQTSYLRDEEVLFANFSIEENPTLSVDDTESKEILTVTPNPVKNTLSLKDIPNTVSLVQIFSIDGRTMLNKTINNKTELNLDVSLFSEGSYIVSFKGKTVSQSKLFVVKK